VYIWSNLGVFRERITCYNKGGRKPAFADMFSYKKRVCVFIDGENMRHAIVELFRPPVFNEWDYLPKNADWTKFFDWIANQAAGADSERVRTYWYVVETLDCVPYGINAARKDLINLERLLRWDSETYDILDVIPTKEDREKRMLEMATELMERDRIMWGRFDGWTYLQNLIAGECNAVEFRRAGSISYNLFKKRLGNEKAVDVKLATDLITLKDIYDVAVIVSGDQDYVPAVDVIKDYGKHVVNVSFLKEDNTLLPGGAKRLNHATDRSLEIKHADLKKHLGL